MMTVNASARPWRSIAAIFAGLLTVIVTHNGIDALLHATHVYPPLDEPMMDPALNALALSYRMVFIVVGACITAWLAPRNPMRHALVLGGIGVVLSTLGAIVMWDFGPAWYPLALIAVSLPCAWAGGRLYARRVSSRRDFA